MTASRAALVAALLLLLAPACAHHEPTPARPAGPVAAEAAPVGPPLPWQARVVDLRWLAGDWIGADAGGTCFVERWLPAAGDSMLGVGRQVAGAQTSGETMRVHDDGRGLVMTVILDGGQVTPFRLTAVSERAFLATRPAGDADEPGALRYELRPDGGLAVQLVGRDGRVLDDVAFRRAPVTDAACTVSTTAR